MNTVLKFDRVILVKELNENFKNTGKEYEVANILDGSFLLREVKTEAVIGVVSFEDFEKHFVREENFKEWTHWIQFTGIDKQNDMVYRTNRKRVQVKSITDNVRAEASCCKDDEFNLSFGLQMAYLRCLNKVLKKKKNEYEENLKLINDKISENTSYIGQMLDTLNFQG